MPKTLITIGSVIDYPTIHEDKVVGHVEQILENTLLIRDLDDETHLVLKSNLKDDGLKVDEKTYIYKTRYNRS